MKENGNDIINEIKENQENQEKENIENGLKKENEKETKLEKEEQKDKEKKIEEKKIVEKKVEEKKVEEKPNINDNNEKTQEIKKIYSSVITTGKEKINDIYLKKVKDLSNIYSYSSNYLLFITQLFKKTSEPFYSKLSSSYINNIKPYLKYFKDLIPILNTFSEKINTLNSTINPELYSNDEESLIRVENNLNLSVKKINSSMSEVYNKISKDIKDIINKPLFIKYETIEVKFEENFHKMLGLISYMEQLRIKYNTEFAKKYVNIFNTFIDKYNAMDNYLLNMKNFFSIEYDIVTAGNFVMNKAHEFLSYMKQLYEDSISIFCDYLEILKKMIKIFYQENKKIILPKILPEKMVVDLEKLINQNIRKNLEKKLSIKNIIEHYHNENLRNEVNHLLLKYQEIFSQSKIIKNELINDLSKFDLQYFKSTEIFFNFLNELIPPNYQLKYEDGIQFKTCVKRDCGLFKRWKECHLVISYQGHILFFDEENTKNNINNIIDNEEIPKKAQSAMINNVNIKTSPGLDDLNDIQIKKKDQVKSGIIPQNLSIMYYKNNYGIRKKIQNKGKFLFEIWEKGLGNKRNKINVIDALNAKNLENILLELTETNIYDD